MEKAPEFCLKDQAGEEHCLKDYRGEWLLLYFYPKDNTPGCTKEACGIRDAWADFKEKGAVVLGVSADTIDSHKKFATKYNLSFPLLADTKKEVIKKYGVWKEKKMFGKTYMGISRESFLINPEGEIVKHYKKVKPDTHAQEVLADLRKLTED